MTQTKIKQILAVCSVASTLLMLGGTAFADSGAINTGTGFVEKDLYVSSIRDEFIKVRGDYFLKKGDKIKGRTSGAIADVNSINQNRSRFKVDYSSPQKLGWRNDIGKLSEDYQVTPNNDYYQNLSYSIKSPLDYETISVPVNSLLHASGLKNFADTQIENNIKREREEK